LDEIRVQQLQNRQMCVTDADIDAASQRVIENTDIFNTQIQKESFMLCHFSTSQQRAVPSHETHRDWLDLKWHTTRTISGI